MKLLKWVGALIALFCLATCVETAPPCHFTSATPGNSEKALLDRAFLNTEYYFSRVPAADRADIYSRPELADLSVGKNVDRCVDDAVARSIFDVKIIAIDQTSATVEVISRNPKVFSWADTWEGTWESWKIEQGNWKMTESKMDSDFVRTYFPE